MRQALDESARRRVFQEEYNAEHGITPKAIVKAVEDILEVGNEARQQTEQGVSDAVVQASHNMSNEQMLQKIAQLDKAMQKAAKSLEFEKAANLRDEIAQYKKLMFGAE